MEKVGKEGISVRAVSNLFHIASIVGQWQTAKAAFIADGMLSAVTIGLWLPGVHQSHFIFIFSFASFLDHVLRKEEGVWKLPSQFLLGGSMHMWVICQLLESVNL